MDRATSPLQIVADCDNVSSARLPGRQREFPARKSVEHRGLTAYGNESRAAAGPHPQGSRNRPSAPERGIRNRIDAHVSASGSLLDLADVRAKPSKPLTIFYGYPR